jgi:dCMP deaminase
MNGRKRLNWPETAMRLAFEIADSRCEDPWVQVGAAIIKHDNSILLGYNGAPAGVDIDWSNRDERRPYVLHAEENVLSRIEPGEAKILAVTGFPCDRCMKLIKQKKIDTVYFCEFLSKYDNNLAQKMAKKFKIKLIQLNPFTL